MPDTDEKGLDPPDRRKTDAGMRETLADLVEMMHDLAPRITQIMPVIDKLEARIPIIDGFAEHLKDHADDKRAREDAEGKRVSAEQVRELQMSTQTEIMTRLDLRARGEDAEVEERRYRFRVLLRSGSILCVSAAGITDTAFLSASWGHFTIAPALLVGSINAVLIGMAAMLQWATTPMPPTSPQQLSPVTTVPPKHVP